MVQLLLNVYRHTKQVRFSRSTTSLLRLYSESSDRSENFSSVGILLPLHYTLIEKKTYVNRWSNGVVEENDLTAPHVPPVVHTLIGHQWYMWLYKLGESIYGKNMVNLEHIGAKDFSTVFTIIGLAEQHR